MSYFVVTRSWFRRLNLLTFSFITACYQSAFRAHLWTRVFQFSQTSRIYTRTMWETANWMSAAMVKCRGKIRHGSRSDDHISSDSERDERNEVNRTWTIGFGGFRRYWFWTRQVQHKRQPTRLRLDSEHVFAIRIGLVWNDTRTYRDWIHSPNTQSE